MGTMELCWFLDCRLIQHRAWIIGAKILRHMLICRGQNTWMISSSMIDGGLSWWQSWLCVWIGYTIAGALICMTGRIGATYHISFPVVSRASFGIWGSMWPVFNRAAMACIWYGVQSWIGGEHILRSALGGLPTESPYRKLCKTHDPCHLAKVWESTQRLTSKL